MEVHTADPLETMAKQISTMTKKLEKLEVAAVSAFGTTSLPCGLCGALMIVRLAVLSWMIILQLSRAEEQQQYSEQQSPLSTSFPATTATFSTTPSSSSTTAETIIFTPSSSIEAALEKLAQSTANFVQNTHSFMNETRSTFKNQESALRNLENQVGQLAKDLDQLTRSTNTFPSDTVVNPKEECKTVTLRSGKVLVDNSNKKVEEKGEDKIVEDFPVKSTTEGAKPLSAPSSSLQIPFPQRL
ncbi:hypothetical protein PIB30_097035 [Stylosanthes scabra]|uniref:Uncharacterized protein n=1 Tax=Stylosanthes scabra TaxID=79078 RepID=A0ABU6WX59_9FABA|nr:hypothetical protein [Stylosanthes scabra]